MARTSLLDNISQISKNEDYVSSKENLPQFCKSVNMTPKDSEKFNKSSNDKLSNTLIYKTSSDIAISPRGEENLVKDAQIFSFVIEACDEKVLDEAKTYYSKSIKVGAK